MVKDKVEEAEWKYFDVNEHWQQMKNIMMDTAQVTCGLSKGLCRHKKTWWWNEKVAEEVREKKKKYGNWKKRKIDRGVEGVQYTVVLYTQSFYCSSVICLGPPG